MRVRAKPLRLKGVHRVKKRLADGSIKEFFYHRATGERLDPANLAASYAAAEEGGLADCGNVHPADQELRGLDCFREAQPGNEGRVHRLEVQASRSAMGHLPDRGLQ